MGHQAGNLNLEKMDSGSCDIDEIFYEYQRNTSQTKPMSSSYSIGMYRSDRDRREVRWIDFDFRSTSRSLRQDETRIDLNRTWT